MTRIASQEESQAKNRRVCAWCIDFLPPECAAIVNSKSQGTTKATKKEIGSWPSSEVLLAVGQSAKPRGAQHTSSDTEKEEEWVVDFVYGDQGHGCERERKGG